MRFFLKDIEPENLYGIDCDPEVIQLCKESNLPGNFKVINPSPPTHFPNDKFHYIYSYSVFSHLSEEIHKAWLKEFQRILKPGGLLIVTTRPRDFILRCAELKKATELPDHAKGSAFAFSNTEECLVQYDSGAYCFSYTGGDGVRHGSFYGETCIPEQYVEKEWGKYLNVLNYLECQTHQRFDQDVIVAQKPIKFMYE
jgi:SAM-dependent methyltransferase